MEGIVWGSEARSLPGGLFIPWSGVSQRFYPVHPCTAVISVLHWHKAYISYFPGQFQAVWRFLFISEDLCFSLIKI